MVEIRPEQEADREAIHRITERAFAGKPFSDGDEPDLIDRLREIGELTLSLVAQDGTSVVGQVTFSRAIAADGDDRWYALGPVSVTPERQRKGIGAMLIEEGLAEITKRGALGCILTGNPDYYRRFGFEVSPAHCPSNESEEHFMLKLLSTEQPVGRFAFHETFYGDT